MGIQNPGKPPKPALRASIKPIKLSSRPSVVRPARPSPPGIRPGPRRSGVQPPGYGIPEWQKGIIKMQNLLAAGARIRVRERVQAATSGGTPSSTARNKGWETRRQKYGASGRKS